MCDVRDCQSIADRQEKCQEECQDIGQYRIPELSKDRASFCERRDQVSSLIVSDERVPYSMDEDLEDSGYFEEIYGLEIRCDILRLTEA